MKKSTFLFSVVAAATLLASTSASFGAVVYSQLGTTGLGTSTTTVPTALDDINFATGSTLIRQELSAMSFGYGELAGTAAQTQAIFVDFYDTVNMASTGIVESSYLGGFGGTLTLTANTGTTTALKASSFSGLTGLATPIFFTDDNIGIVVTFVNAAGTAYSSVLTPLYSLSAPTVGTSVLGLYRDAGNDDFQQTDFTAAQGNLYLSLTTVNAPVPEPSTWAIMGLGLVGGAVIVRRRRLVA